MDNSVEKIIDVKEFLKSNGYRYYPSRVEYPYEEKALYQKRIESDSVCDTNDGLFINVHLVRFQDHQQPSFGVEITAEKNSIWWRLMAYSLSENELIEKLTDLERLLCSMFNRIVTVQECDAIEAQSSEELLSPNNSIEVDEGIEKGKILDSEASGKDAVEFSKW